MNIYKQVISHFGGIKATADALQNSYKTVWAWDKGTRKPRPETCSLIEEKSNGAFTCKQLCDGKQ